MSSSIKFNKKDVDRILGKLTKITDEIKSPNGLIFEYRFILLDEYAKAVAAAMGSVRAVSGGRAKFGNLHIGAPQAAYWDALSPYTLAKKGGWGGKDANYSLTIWKDTGETQKAVQIYDSNGSPMTNKGAPSLFAGIPGGTEAYRKALATEFGAQGGGWGQKSLTEYTDWPSRPLFTVVNAAFKANKPAILEAMRQRIISITRNAGWGS